MYFGKKHIIVGSDKFYKIDLYSYKLSGRWRFFIQKIGVCV